MNEQINALPLTEEQRKNLQEAINRNTQSTEQEITKAEYKKQLAMWMKSMEAQSDQSDLSPEAKAELKAALKQQVSISFMKTPERMSKQDAVDTLYAICDGYVQSIISSQTLSEAEKQVMTKEAAATVHSMTTVIEADRTVAVVDQTELAKAAEETLVKSKMSEAQNK